MITSLERKRRLLDLNKLLGERLQRMRESRNVLQEDAAQYMDFARSNISKIENGDRTLAATEICDYAAAIGVKPQDIFDAIQQIAIEYDGETGRRAAGRSDT